MQNLLTTQFIYENLGVQTEKMFEMVTGNYCKYRNLVSIYANNMMPIYLRIVVSTIPKISIVPLPRKEKIK